MQPSRVTSALEAYQVGTDGTVSGAHTSQRAGLRPKAVTGATALSFTFLQKVCEAGSNSCVMGLAVSRKSLQQILPHDSRVASVCTRSRNYNAEITKVAHIRLNEVR